MKIGRLHSAHLIPCPIPCPLDPSARHGAAENEEKEAGYHSARKVELAMHTCCTMYLAHDSVRWELANEEERKRTSIAVGR